MKLIGFKFLLVSLFVTLFISKAECSVSPTSLLSAAYQVYNWLKSVTNTWSYRLEHKTASTWDHRTPSHQKEARNVIETEINKGDNTDMTAQKVLENLEDVASVRNWYVKIYKNDIGPPYEHLTGDGQYVVIHPAEYFVAIGPFEGWITQYVTEDQMRSRANYFCEEGNKLKRSNGQHGDNCDY
ncbi:unnamed protein product [Cunninghamella echinulata]